MEANDFEHFGLHVGLGQNQYPLDSNIRVANMGLGLGQNQNLGQDLPKFGFLTVCLKIMRYDIVRLSSFYPVNSPFFGYPPFSDKIILGCEWPEIG